MEQTNHQDQQENKQYNAWGDEVHEPEIRFHIIQEVKSKPISWWKGILLILLIVVIAAAVIMLATLIRTLFKLPMSDMIVYLIAIIMGVWLINRRICEYRYELTDAGIAFSRRMSRLDRKMVSVTADQMRSVSPYRPESIKRSKTDQFRLKKKTECQVLTYLDERGKDCAVIFQPNEEVLRALREIIKESELI